MKLILTLVAFVGLQAFLSAQTETIFKGDAITSIQITFAGSRWSGQLDSMRINNQGALPAKVTIGNTVLPNAAVSIISGREYTPNSKRNKLYIDFDVTNPDFLLDGTHGLILSHALRDPSHVREVVAFEMAADYFEAQRAGFSTVRINGEYYGLMPVVEPVERPFLKHHYRTSNGALYEAVVQEGNTLPSGCNPRFFSALLPEDEKCYEKHYNMLKGDSWSPLDNMMRILARGNTPEIARALDIDKVLWMHAFNTVTGSLFSYTGIYANNYYLFQLPDGRFEPILGSQNFAFGSFKNTGEGEDLMREEIEQLDPFIHADNELKPLISKLMADPGLRKRYTTYVRYMYRNHMKSGKLAERMRYWQDLIREERKNDTNNSYTLIDFDRSMLETVGQNSKIPGLLAFIQKRSAFLSTYPDLVIIPPTMTEPAFQPRKKMSNESVNSFRISTSVDRYTKRVFVYYRFADNERFQRLELMDDGNHFDEKAGDLIFGAEITPPNGQKNLEYYVEAENARLYTYFPAKYSKEPLTVSLNDLNR